MSYIKNTLVISLVFLLSIGGAVIPDSGSVFMPVAHADDLPSVWQRKLKKLQKNITRSRENLANAVAADFQDDFKAKQWRNRVANYRLSYDKVPQSTDPIASEVAKMLSALESELAARLSGSSPAKTTISPTTANQSNTQDNNQSTSSSTSAGSASDNSQTSDVRELVSGERVRVKKLIRDISNGIKNISGEGPSPFQDPDIVAQRKKVYQQYAEALKRYPQANDPDVIELRAVFKSLGNKLSAEFKRSREQLKIVGNAFERLETISNRNDEYPVPSALQPPFSVEQAQAWLDAGSKARTAAEFDMKQLQEIGPNAYLPEQTVSGRMAQYNFRDIDRLARAVRERFDAVQQSYIETNNKIATQLAVLENQLQEPSAGDDSKKTVRHREALDEMIEIAASTVHLESVLKRPTDQATSRVDSLKQRRTEYDKKREAAIDAIRMPEPKSQDAEMLAIARQVVEKPAYEFGQHGPIVLNATGMTDRETETSEIDIDKVEVYGGDVTLSGTETTWTYRWREFQFATALQEPDSDLWRINYIMAKYYTSGSSSTPLNQWISGGVVATDLIRKEQVFQ